MSRSYEELMGALGRGVFFRPARRRARDFLSRAAEPRVVIRGRGYELHDISMNGLSFACAHTEPEWETGAEVDLKLQLYGKSAFAGRARVVRAEQARGGARVALALTSGFLDLPEIVRRDEEGQLERELRGGSDAVTSRVPHAYRDVVARAAHFLQYYRKTLDRHEARCRRENAQVGEALTELTEKAAAALRPAWFELEHDASRTALGFLSDPEALRAAKQYTETMVTPLLLDCPMQRRSYLKPLGYPGDYQVMLYYYDNSFEGESVFARVFHKFFVEHPLSNGVRTRKNFMVDLMEREHDRLLRAPGGSCDYRVTSLGCGPAREVADYIDRRVAWAGTAQWTLIDQEEETLSIAFRDGQRALSQHGAQGQLSCLNLSFVQLLNDPSLLAGIPTQHVIYSTGLFDYLHDQRAQTLLAALYERLEVSGLLAIGNAMAPNLHFWSPELVLDWTLLYRSKAEMLKLASKLPAGAELEVVVEPGQAYYFLLVRKH